MITRTAGMVAAAALLATPVFADEGWEPKSEEGFYVSAAGGAVWLNDIDIFTGSPYVGETDTGWAAIGAAGYKFGNGFRGELEVGYRQNDGLVFSVFEGLPVADFDVDALDIMANGYYDFRTGSFIEPYIGAGVGTANVDFDFGPGEGEDDAWAFAYQFIGGFNVPLPNSRVSLFADYRYLATEGLDVDFGGEIEHDEYRSHTVLGGGQKGKRTPPQDIGKIVRAASGPFGCGFLRQPARSLLDLPFGEKTARADTPRAKNAAPFPLHLRWAGIARSMPYLGNVPCSQAVSPNSGENP